MANILIVDDRPTNREFLIALLGYSGHRLLEAADGTEGLAITRAERPDLVIADILMPTMDGYEFVRQIRADPAIAETRVIFYTAHYHETEARKLAAACSVSAVLTKPCEPEVVLRTVEAALGHTEPPPPPTTDEFDREHLRVLTDKLSQQTAELQRTNERLTAIVELGTELGSERDAGRLLQVFCDAAREIVGARFAVVGIPNGNDGLYRHLLTSGLDLATVARVGRPAPLGGILGSVIGAGRCFRTSNHGELDKVGVPTSFPAAQVLLAAPVSSPAHVYGWVCLFDKLGAEAFTDEDERLAGMLAAQVGRIYENGSLYADLLQHTKKLALEVAERQKAEQRLTVQHAVVRLLAEAPDLQHVAPRLLQTVCETTGWDVGDLWIVDRKANVLTCVDLWHIEDERIVEFRELSRRLTFAPGASLPGRVWLTQKPAWIVDVTKDPHFPRHAVATQAGLHGGFGFPIRCGDDILGVAEFFSRQSRQPDEELIRLFEGLGSQIGQFMERKRAEHGVRLFRTLVDQTTDGIEVIDPETGRYLDANERACASHGYTREEYLRLGVPDVDPIAATKPWKERIAEHRQLGIHTFESKHRRKDGSIFPVEVNLNPSSLDGAYVVAIVRDITDRKRAEEALQQAQQRLTHVIASSPAVLFTLRIENHTIRGISWISGNLQELLGYSPTAASNPDWWSENIHPDEREQVITQTHTDLLANNRTSHEYRFRHHDGQYRWTRGDIRLIRDALGQPVEAVGSWSDITERKLLEDQFRQAQKMEAVGRLAGGVAHDFNNLLTIINGYGELVLGGLPPGNPTRELLQEIVAAGERATGLTRQLLAFSRKSIIAPKVLDLKSIVNDVDRMLRRIVGEDIELSITAAQNVGAVRADPGQIEQVILNLVVNARDAMPRGGRLTIELRNAALDEASTWGSPEVQQGLYVLLSVSDTGCGMDCATMTRIFEPFFSTKGEHGTGLGLATVQSIVKQSGGYVGVSSEVGQGTTFKIYLPRIAESPTADGPRSKQSMMAKGNEIILLVEDDDGVRGLARRILGKCGYTVLAAREGAEAVRLAGQQERVDLLITDVVMPLMDGREVADQVSELHPGVKVLFLSGYTDDAVIRHGILEAEVAFHQKPFTPASLSAKVRDVLIGG